jgi:hypothetical protein
VFTLLRFVSFWWDYITRQQLARLRSACVSRIRLVADAQFRGAGCRTGGRAMLTERAIRTGRRNWVRFGPNEGRDVAAKRRRQQPPRRLQGRPPVHPARGGRNAPGPTRRRRRDSRRRTMDRRAPAANEHFDGASHACRPAKAGQRG